MVGRLAGAYRNFLSAWERRIQRRAWLVTVLMLTVTLGLGWFTVLHSGAERSGASAAPLILVVESGNPDLAARTAARLADALRSRPEAFAAVVYPPGEPFFRANALLYLDLPELEALSARLTSAQPVLDPLLRDASLRGLQEMIGLALQTPAAIDLAGLLAGMDRVAEAQLRDRPALLSWRGLLGGMADRPAREVVVIEPRGGAPEQGAAAGPAIAATVQQLGLGRDEDIRLTLTGAAVLEQEARHAAGEELVPRGLAAAIPAVALLWWGLGLPGLAVAVALAAGTAAVWTLALSAVLPDPPPLPAGGAFVLIPLALCTLFSLRIVSWSEELRARGEEAVGGAAEAGPGVTAAALAAVLVLLCLLPSPSAFLARLGLVAAGGAAVAWAIALILLPALIDLIPNRRIPRMAPAAAPPPLSAPIRLTLAGLLAVAALAAVPSARIDADPLGLADSRSEAAAALRSLADRPWISPYGAVARATTLAEAQSLAERLRGLAPVARAVTLADELPRDQEAKLRIIGDLAARLAPSLAEPQAPPLSNVEKQKAVAALQADLTRFAAEAAPGPAKDAAARLAAALGRVGEGGAEALSDLQARLLGGLPDRLAALRGALAAGPVSLADLPADIVARATAPDGGALVSILPAGDPRDPTVLRRFVDALRTVAPAVAGPAVEIADRGRAIEASLLKAGALALVLAALILPAAGQGRRGAAAASIAAPILAVLTTIAFATLTGRALTPATLFLLPLAATFALAARDLPPRVLLFGGLALILAAAVGFGLLSAAAVALALVSVLLFHPGGGAAG